MLISTALIPLQVVLPLVAAPLCAMMQRSRLAWGFTTAVVWASFAIAVMLFLHVMQHGELSYAMGGWKAPIGIEYRIDALNAMILVLISGIAAIAMPFALHSIDKEIPIEKHPTFYGVFLLCFTGLLGITSTNDAFNVYVFLEISSLATYTLIAMGRSRKALSAAFEYLILGTIGATFILIGIGALYMMTGTLNISDLSLQLADKLDTRPVIAAFSFIVIGLALKIALFPLHIWLTNAYAYAPSFISVFLSATATKVSIYVLIRFIYMLFGKEFSYETLPIGELLMILSVIAILVGSLVAIFQRNIKRMLAFSSVAQVGYILLALSLHSDAGLVAGLVHIINHAVAKAGLFLAVGCVAYKCMGNVQIEAFKGIGRQAPLLMVGFTLAGLSLIGVPATAGFISKWYIIQALIAQGYWLVVIAVIISSLLAVIYIWRVVEYAFFKEMDKTMAKETASITVPYSMQLSLWFMVACNIIFGFYTHFTVGTAHHIAAMIGGSV